VLISWDNLFICFFPQILTWMGEERTMMRRREEITRVSWRPWQRSTERKSRPTSSVDSENINYPINIDLEHSAVKCKILNHEVTS
jgi:hypothetical protein